MARKSSGRWIQGAIKNKGSLRRTLKVKSGQTIPASKLRAAAKKGGKTGQRARLAMTLKGLNKSGPSKSRQSSKTVHVKAHTRNGVHVKAHRRGK